MIPETFTGSRHVATTKRGMSVLFGERGLDAEVARLELEFFGAYLMRWLHSSLLSPGDGVAFIDAVLASEEMRELPAVNVSTRGGALSALEDSRKRVASYYSARRGEVCSHIAIGDTLRFIFKDPYYVSRAITAETLGREMHADLVAFRELLTSETEVTK